MAGGPLAGIQVLDLTQGVAGPYCTKLFADYGADVVKIERPGAGDPARRAGPFPDDIPHPERSGMFLELNTNKQSVTLNLKTASGRRLLRRLAGSSDLVIESFRPGTLDRLGLDGRALRELNPCASLVSISSFGQSGPYRDLEADDLLAYAMGGVLSVTAYPEREPVRIGLYAPLFLAGGVAASFAFGAYLGARRSGAGERVDLSIMEVLATSMDRGGPNLASLAYTGELGHRGTTTRGTTAMPAGVYPCRDGYVMINTQVAWWPRICRAIGRPDLIEDPRYLERLFDPEFAPEIDALVYPWLLERSKQEAMEAAQAEGWPVSALNTTADTFADRHLRARDFFTTLDHPEAGALEYAGLPFRMVGTPGELRRAPLLGEHTARVLVERLGHSREEIVILRQRGAI